MDDYKPLEAYGVIGNLETCALVGRDGSIDWCCLPYIQSPSVFGSILDAEKGGSFAVRPTDPFESEHRYLDRTNVLETTFRTDSGTATITDFMPIVEDREQEEPQLRGLYRRVSCTDGSLDLDVTFAPRFDYARVRTRLESVADGVLATGEQRRISLAGSADIDFSIEDGTASGSVRLEEGDSVWFVLEYSMYTPVEPEVCESLLDETIEYWREWAHSCNETDCVFGDMAHDLVVRSELLLKLLNYRETGAFYAAPTTSLPEDIGGVRNWDYRFSWIRDGAITVRALTNLDHTREAEEYVHRFLELSRAGDTAAIQPLYGVEGDADLDEEELDHLSGYRDSRPVRIGNEAAEQQQLDVYGSLILAFYQRFWTHDQDVENADWQVIAEVAEYVCENWDQPGAGIWELRGEPRQLVHSKVMCWTVLDRALSLAEHEGIDCPVDRWSASREAIKETVLENGFDGERNTFTQSYEAEKVDASGLMVVLSGILPFDDPRIIGTVEAIQEDLATEEGLVYRYTDDGLPGEEGAFVLCSFWLVDALVAIGRVEEARAVFENVLEYTNPLGLLAEEIDPEAGHQLGNFPQGFSHIGLINSALYLKEADYDWADIEPVGEPTLVQEQEH